MAHGSEPGSNPWKLSERRMTGTFVAVTIAAGIAACILEFARMNEMEEGLYQELRSLQGMQTSLTETIVERRDQLNYIYPKRQFADYRTNEEIFILIRDPLKRWALQSMW
jgi:hypothetical protein